ncbi:PREDICTED: protein AF-9-like [Ipomoea nil]|uniref:protein AF-9-like n=1 Tax=Ipomoea nil TaxID=35883 RepID=UPI00090198A3|nr:PREDICTED: protein AF-9-like [Ipomoea nil]
MTDSDSQNASIADYDEEVEHLSDEEVDIMSYSPEAIYRPAPAPEQAAAQDTSSSSSGSSSSSSSGSGSSGEEEEEEGTTSGRQGSPTEGARETPTRVVGDHPEAVARGSDRENTPEQAEEDTAGPAAPATAEFEFLNSENVEQQMSRLTTGEAARIAERLAQKALKKSDEDRALAEKVAHRAIEEAKQLKAQLGNPSELAQAVFKDNNSGSAFLTAARGTKVGEDLILSFGRWAFKAGQRKMLERARTRMEQALEGEDLQLVLSTLPPDLADPGPSPFSPKEKTPEQGGSSAAAANEKETAAGARETKK